MAKRFITLFALLLSALAIHAQRSAPPNTETPAWVTQMEDPNANYFQALKTYDQYWRSHEKPDAENDVAEEKLPRRERRIREKKERELSQMTPTQRQWFQYLVYQCKRFENWQREVLPFVQEDGHILTMEERQAIWQQQQQEIKRNR
ncbi:MAG: hypothetical protein U0T73_00060 [Chitinophagales bacterium]